MTRFVIRALAPLAAILAAGCTSSVSSKYAGGIGAAPASHVTVCHGYDCTFRDRLWVGKADARRIAAIMAAGRAGPDAERKAVGKVIQLFELRAADMLGHRDTPMSQFSNAGTRGEMDCIDEAMNSRAVVSWLAGRGLLRHHVVGENASRGFMLDGQFPHAAATIVARDGVAWAIDSWEGPPGAPPIIMALSRWRVSGDIGREFGAAF